MQTLILINNLYFKKKENVKFLAQYTRKELKSNDSLYNQFLVDSMALVTYNDIKARRDTLLKRADLLIKNDISNVNYSLAIGWNDPVCKSGKQGCYILLVAGWIITALAISLGASFWFDLLNKFMKLRASLASSSAGDKQK